MSTTTEVSSIALKDALRRLWTDHVVWTREYIRAAIGGSPDAETEAGRLLRNQEDIGAAVVPFYGKEAGAELTRLLKEHILIAVDALNAAIEDDERGFRRHDRRWSQNADEIAALLASANPNWPEADLQDLLAQHLKLTKLEMLARFDEEWETDVDRFNDIFTEILTVADALVDGLAAQFPDRVNGQVNPEQASLHTAMRKLWADHTIWTREYIVAAVAGTKDAEAAAARLLRNQEDIGAAIVPLYGPEAGAELIRLLKDHILIAVDLVAAAIAGEERAFARHDKRWEDNADDIAAFLAGANPNWPEADVRDLLGQHLRLTKGEAVARLTKDWDADVAAYDDILTEILTMADALSEGIVKQFPEHFGLAAPAAAATPATSGWGDGRTPLHAAMRRLWADHTIWTRQYIVAAVGGTPDAEAAAGRLLKNQEDIGNAIVPLYGEAAGAELTRLLKDHILIAVDLVAAAISGDQRAFRKHDRRWDDNADEIAAFLAGANPNWPEADVRDLLGQHLKLTKGEAVARLSQDWSADVAAFDDIFTEIMTMADALTDGILAQFPGGPPGNGQSASAAPASVGGGEDAAPAPARRRRRAASSLS